MDMLALIGALSVAGSIIFGLMAVYQGTASPRSSMERRLGSLLAESTGFEVSEAAAAQAMRPKKAGRMFILGDLLQGKVWTEQMAGKLQRADINLTVSEFVAIRLFTAVFAGMVPLLMVSGLPGPLLAVVLAWFGYMLPGIYLGMAQGRRMSKLQNQLPDTLTMIANSLKAGFGMMQALDLSSREMQAPVATELRRTIQDVNVGSRLDEALMNMAKRNDSPDLDIVVTAMLIQQSTGGNLSEILENVAHTMRERTRIRGEIKTLTSQQLLSGVIIGALPIFIGGFVFVINPGYIMPLFSETAGQVMLVGATMLELFGVFLIKRILTIEV